MKTRASSGVVATVAFAALAWIAACGDDASGTLLGGVGPPRQSADISAGAPEADGGTATAEHAATGSAKGKAYFVATVHPTLAASCGA